MRFDFSRLRRTPLTRRTLGRAVLAVTLAGLLLARGRTMTIDCVSDLASPGIAEAAAMASMPMVNWFANHPARGQSASATAAVTDSFSVVSNYFDENNDGSITQVDTAFVTQGDIVKWKWVSGIHTITNGTGSSDPDAGTLFDQPATTTNRSFSFQFNTVGTFPFFCRNHETTNMKGIVVVSADLTSVGPVEPGRSEGFTRLPWPNPARAGTTFQFALARPGHVRVTILDAQGRRVATTLEGDFAAGTFESHWSGRTAEGAAAAAGVYFVRLELAGRSQTRRIAIVH